MIAQFFLDIGVTLGVGLVFWVFADGLQYWSDEVDRQHGVTPRPEGDATTWMRAK